MLLKNQIEEFKKNIKDIIARNSTNYPLFFLISIITLAYIIPVAIFQSPIGTDVYFHMVNSQRMAETDSLAHFYQESFFDEELSYDYPFGLWYFTSIMMKVTGMDINTAVYVLPLILMLISLLVFYIYSKELLLSKEKSIFSVIFFISMPLLAIGMLNFSTSRFVTLFLIMILFLSIKKFDIKNGLILGILTLFLVISHTGTFIFLMFLAITYFFLAAALWKKFDMSMYCLIVELLLVYVIAIDIFPYIQQQYIDRGLTIISMSNRISSVLHVEIIKEFGKVLYENVYVSNNLVYVIFWACLIYAVGKIVIAIHHRILKTVKTQYHAIPFLGSFQNVSHNIVVTPFWIGPIHTLLSVVGFFKLDMRGKCLALSLFIAAVLPGASHSDIGTGALREISYLYLIIPICATAGFFIVLDTLEKKVNLPAKKTILSIFVGFILLVLMLTPIIGNLYYQPQISGITNDRENLNILGHFGSNVEGVSDYAYNEKIVLYANKSTSNIPSGTEKKRYYTAIRNVYFAPADLKYLNDLNSFNIQYVLSSDRTLKELGFPKEALRIDANTNLDKIISSTENFSVYRIYSPPPQKLPRNSEDVNTIIYDNAPKIQDFGSMYLVENENYKIRVSQTNPQIYYLGTRAKNLIGDGIFSDYISITWSGGKLNNYIQYNLKNIEYPNVSVNNNRIEYRGIIKNRNNTENWATIIITYTFYDKNIKREILVADDWQNSNSNENMNLGITTSLFAPFNKFQFNQITKDGIEAKVKKIYPAQDSVVIKDKKFNDIYFDEGSTGFLLTYGDSVPYPDIMTYLGSPLYDYGVVTMGSINTVQPGEPANIVQYFTVGTKPLADRGIQELQSVGIYPYPYAIKPLSITGTIESQKGLDDFTNISPEYTGNLNENYVIAVPPGKDISPSEGWKTIGFIKTYLHGYLNVSAQSELVKAAIESTELKGVLFRAFKYNIDSIDALRYNGVSFAQGTISASAPYQEYGREGIRNPKFAYYQGEKTGIILLPVSLPLSQMLHYDIESDKVFANWNRTLDTVNTNGGLALFIWDPEDIADSEYTDKFQEMLTDADNRGMKLVTPDTITDHMARMQNIATHASKGVDYVVLNVTNKNYGPAAGITYDIKLPAFNGTCPYNIKNAVLSREEIMEDSCILYISVDLAEKERKMVTIEPSVPRNQFKVDFSDIYEGDSTLRIINEEGDPVNNAEILLNHQVLTTNEKGVAKLTLSRGICNLTVQKPGYATRDYQIEVKGKIFRYLQYFA